MTTPPMMLRGGRYRGFGAAQRARARAMVSAAGRWGRDNPMEGFARYAVGAASLLTIFLAVRMSEVIPVLASLRPVIIITVLVTWYLVTKTRRDVMLRTLSDPVVIALAVYGIAGIVGVPFALMRSLAFGSLDTIGYCTLLTIGIMLVPPTLKALDRYTTITVLGATAACVVWILAGRDKRGSGRLTSDGSYDPNDLGAMVALFLPLSLGMMVRGPVWRRLLGLVSSIACVLMILLTSSRGAMVAVCAILVAFLVTMKPSRAIASVLVAVPLMLAVWTFAPDQFKQRASTLESVDEDYNMTLQTGRVAIWKRGWMHFTEHPIVGVGIGNYSVAEGNYFSSRNVVAAYFTAHNTYIQAFVEFGIFGGLALCYLVFSAFQSTLLFARRTYNGRDNPIHRPEYFASMAGYFTAAFFLSHAIVYLLFAALGLATLVRNVHRAQVQRIS